jgi:cytoskeletal protein RodZ
VSLIDEALKRAELEAARRDGLRTGASPWVMENRARRNRRPILAAAVVLLAAAGGVAFWLTRRPSAVEPPRPAPAGNSAQSKIQNPKSKIEMETVQVPPPPAAIQPKDPRRHESPAPAAKSEPASPQPARVAEKRPAPPAEERPNASAPAESRNPRGLANGRTYVGEVAIPDGGKVTLEGIVWSEANPVALINGKVLPPGGIVEEFTIASIQPDRVELKGRGITIFVSLK